jgi:hypothetical protein
MTQLPWYDWLLTGWCVGVWMTVLANWLRGR